MPEDGGEVETTCRSVLTAFEDNGPPATLDRGEGGEEPGGGISVTIGNEGPGDNLLSARGKNTARGGVKNHTFAK
jgi:hypothetical protein